MVILFLGTDSNEIDNIYINIEHIRTTTVFFKGAVGVHPGRPGLDDLDGIRVDLDEEASRSTGSGLDWPVCWLAGCLDGWAGLGG